LISHYYVDELECAELSGAAFSVPASADYPADATLNGSLSESGSSGTDITWTADINNGPALVKEIDFNSVGLSTALKSANVYVDDILCG
jgi:hypothetical protein